MDFKHQVYDIISQFSGQNNIITINVAYVDFVGDIETAILLSQIIYWTDRTTRNDGFFYKTDEDWQEEIRLSKYAIRKARKKLEEMGFLETKVKKANGNPTVHYRLDRHRFVESFISFLRNRKNEIAKTKKRNCENKISLTEITTETTTEITTSIVNDKNIYQFYEQSFGGTISPIISQQIEAWVNDTSEELVIQAMKIAKDKKKGWQYAEGILKQWAQQGIKHLSDLEKTKKNTSAPRQAKTDVWDAFQEYMGTLGGEEDDKKGNG